MTIKFSGHAVKQMFQRQISRDAVIAVIKAPKIVMEYPEDKPWPSKLLLGFDGPRPLHVVLAHDMKADIGVVVTVYIPQPDIWTNNYLERRK